MRRGGGGQQARHEGPPKGAPHGEELDRFNKYRLWCPNKLGQRLRECSFSSRNLWPRLFVQQSTFGTTSSTMCNPAQLIAHCVRVVCIYRVVVVYCPRICRCSQIMTGSSREKTGANKTSRANVKSVSKVLALLSVPAVPLLWRRNVDFIRNFARVAQFRILRILQQVSCKKDGPPSSSRCTSSGDMLLFRSEHFLFGNVTQFIENSSMTSDQNISYLVALHLIHFQE